MATIPSLNTIVPGGVTGYWVIRNKVNGHSAIVAASSKNSATTPALPLSVIKQLGTSTGNDLQGYYMGGNPSNIEGELFKAIGKLNLSIDTIPTKYTAATTKGFQPLNFDQLTPTGVNPNAYQQGIHTAAQTLTQALNLSGWEEFAFRALEGLVGVALLLLALSAATGKSDGNPVTAVKTVTATAAKVAR